MTKKRKDITGEKFHNLLVLNYSHTKNSNVYWICKCECGNIVTAQANNILSGHTKSCGCIRKWSPGYDKNGKKTRLYRIWSAMKSRCYNNKNQRYKYYGGKGIKVCEQWHNFINFYDWAMANGYENGLSIDRIDSNDDYKPENCQWIPKKPTIYK